MFKIAVISDMHLGFAHGTIRGEDAFNNCKQAFQKALDEKAELILIPGDIFHEKIPRQEVLGKVIELFSSLKKHMKKEPRILTSKTKEGETKLNKKIPPIITIYGTHERRHSDSTNPVHILEKAGLLYNLHAESILIEMTGDSLGLHGLSGVPENYAKQALDAWKPKPFKDCPNILMVHQNFKELIPELETGYMQLADLPKGFHMFLLGHVHWNMEFKHPLTKAPILVPGSTVKTQLTQKEAEKEKGIYIIAVGREKGNVKFIPIETRPLYYHKIKIDNESPANILKKITKQIKDDIKKSKEIPLIRIKLSGVLKEKYSPTDINLKKIIDEFENKAIISMDKSKLQSSSLSKSSRLLVDLKENKISIEELGLKILQDSLKEPIDTRKLESIFNLLVEQELEKVEKLIPNTEEPKKSEKKEEPTPKTKKQVTLDGSHEKKQPVAQSKKLTTLDHF